MSVRLARVVLGLCLVFVTIAGSSLGAAPVADAAGPKERFLVVARTAGDYDELRAAAQRAGGTIVKDLRDANMLVVTGADLLKGEIQATGLARAVAKDHVETLMPPDGARAPSSAPSPTPQHVVDAATSRAVAAAQGRRPVTGDPAFGLPGLMWSIERIQAPQAWQTTTGLASVKVAVADTGLDFTHAELAPKVANVVDFTATEDPPICKTLFGIGDSDLAASLGGPVTTDWNGHGSWIGGNIAAAMDDRGVNGIAPRVTLVSLKISQWCGAAYDSTILDAFVYAGEHNIDVVSISFGGYLDRTDPDQATIWSAFNQVVQRLRDQGTIIAASAGNEHLQIGTEGVVTSHGPTVTPGTTLDQFVDYFGLFETPGGVPGVIDVSSTGNVVVRSSVKCGADQVGSAANTNAVCKPRTDDHQAQGQGQQDQLAYYSNYGPRIDVAGPGGARKFNLPVWDRGGTPGFPYTEADFTTAYEDFSTTSNWAQVVPCFVFTGGGFPPNQCYSTIQGTSMATPHASGVLALIASNDASARGNPARLERILKNSARRVTGNQTQVLSATDTSEADLTGVRCPTGYCHLGGDAVKDSEAYGAGVVDARKAVNR